jgi:hypothetical protein
MYSEGGVLDAGAALAAGANCHPHARQNGISSKSSVPQRGHCLDGALEDMLAPFCSPMPGKPCCCLALLEYRNAKTCLSI